MNTKLNTYINDFCSQLDLAPTYRVDHLQGDASSREYFRIHFPNQTFILMSLGSPSTGPLSGELGSENLPQREAHQDFVDILSLFENNNIRVPKLHALSQDHRALLLEDLGDNLLLNYTQKHPDQIETLYSKAIEELVKINSLPHSQNICFQRSFDEKLLMAEFYHFVEYALDKRLSKKMSLADRNQILHQFEIISAQYTSWTQVLCHRDFHSRNLLVNDDSSIAVIDFQDALSGPIMYDLASLLRDSYILLEPQVQIRLVRQHYEYCKEQSLHMGLTFEGYLQAFHLIGTHRNLKAAGRFCYIDEVKGNPSYLKDVPRSLDYVIQTLDDYEELHPLRDLVKAPMQEISETILKDKA